MSRITKIFWGEKKSVGFDTINGIPFFSPEYNTRDIKDLTRTDYLRLYTGWAYVAVSTIADTVASLDRELTRSINTTDSINHPYENLITYELLQSISSFLDLNGSCYIWKVMIWNKIDSLEILRPDIVMFDETTDGVLKGYKYTVNNRQMYFDKDEIIAIHNFNPVKTYPYQAKWVSPMQAVAIQMDMDLTATRWNYTFFKNGGSVKDTLTTDQKVSDEYKTRLSTKWRNEFQWVNNAHKLAVLDQWLKYESLSPSQKEMDFVESRRFTRDEVFAIFKVPQSILGITENSNRSVAEQAEKTFYKNCILPRSTVIAEAFNKQLFNGIWYFYFDNVLPQDYEQLSNDLKNGAITINEYRQARGFAKVKEGDVLQSWFGEPIPITYEKQAKTAYHGTKNNQNIVNTIVNDKILSKTVGTKEYIKSRDEYWQKVREQKIQRTDQYERKYIDAIKIIFAEQERDMIGALSKSVKGYKDSWNTVKYVSMWLSLIWPISKDLVLQEAQEALALVGIETAFKPWSDVLDKYTRANIKKFAKEVDMVTKNKIFDIIDAGNNSGASIQEITQDIKSQFNTFDKKRASTIARTEVTRASNQASEMARKDSGVVESKEWFTASDERVCEFCWPMNGKIITIWDNFFDKWHKLLWANGGLMALDYDDVKTPWLHPNCRCTLLPVIE